MKATNRVKLYARAERALCDLYHNATPSYPSDLYGRTDDYFQQWLNDATERESHILHNSTALYRWCGLRAALRYLVQNLIKGK